MATIATIATIGAGSAVAIGVTSALAQATGKDTAGHATDHGTDGMAGMAGMSMGADTAAGRRAGTAPGMAMSHGPAGGHRMPPMPAGMQMMPGTEVLHPQAAPFLPGAGVDAASLPEGTPSQVVVVADGDTLALEARLIRRTIRGATYAMYGFNGQYPGPLIRVRQNATVYVRFTNHIDLPSSIHWHGVRLDNRFDGAVGMTQAAVPPGGTFLYQVRFPDAGIYWYHPHVREDIEQGMGLFGNALVDSPDANYYNAVNAEAVLMLDDLLVDRQGVIPFGQEAADFSIMGRFGNMFLVNGEPGYHLAVRRGDVVRFFVTNASNARSYNLSFGGAPIKLVAADLGKYEREQMVGSLVIAPAQRFVAEVRFDSAGTYTLTNRVQAVNNYAGEYFAEVDTLGSVTVSRDPTTADHGRAFATLRSNPAVIQDIDRVRPLFAKPPDHELTLTVNIQGLPNSIVSFMTVDTMYFSPVEWNDGMPDMNWVSTAKEVHWIMRDPATGNEDMAIDWRFKQGDMVKLRIHNDAASMHPMGHPIHFHGQRFLVVARDGVPTTDVAWQDTDLIPVGSTDDILLDASNPGTWMAHCHIAEHLEAGMRMQFTVEPRAP
jgi:FtsP/CotA-like multicopper oxidase with cupredoxin domain